MNENTSLAPPKAEALPDTMYSRDVAVRLLRHAAWYCMCTRRFHLAPIFAAAQQQVLMMSTGDFYRIKIMGTQQHAPTGEAN